MRVGVVLAFSCSARVSLGPAGRSLKGSKITTPPGRLRQRMRAVLSLVQYLSEAQKSRPNGRKFVLGRVEYMGLRRRWGAQVSEPWTGSGQRCSHRDLSRQRTRAGSTGSVNCGTSRRLPSIGRWGEGSLKRNNIRQPRRRPAQEERGTTNANRTAPHQDGPVTLRTDRFQIDDI